MNTNSAVPHGPWKPLAIISTTLVVVLSLLLLPACCCVTRPAAMPPGPAHRIPEIGAGQIPTPTEADAKRPTDVVMQNVDFHLDNATILNIHYMRAQMTSRAGPLVPLNLDNKTSFTVRIDSALVGMKAASLEVLLNRYVFGYTGSPLSALQVSFAGQQMRLEGTMHKVVAIPFSMLADIAVTPDGRIRLHPTRLDICGINGLSLLKALGTSLGKMLDLSKAKGVVTQGDDLILDATAVLPPPEIEGRLVDAHVEGDELVQVFKSGLSFPDLAPPNAEKNFMYYRGGTLRMGKLLMVDSDMEVADSDPSDRFDFSIDRYNEQLVAGYSRNQPDYGLLVYMRDFDDLGTPCRPGERGFCK